METETIAEAADKRVAGILERENGKNDADLRRIIREVVDDMSKRIRIPENVKKETEEQIYNRRRKMGILQPFLDDSSVNEIMINGTEGIFIEKGGEVQQTQERFLNRENIYNMVQNILSRVNRTVNESNPIADARLPDGSRVNVVLSPVAVNGHIVTIRKFTEKVFNMEQFEKMGTVTEQEGEFLKNAVKKRRNILVSGGTSTGKTTFLNVLSSFIGEKERIVTIEDSAELRLCQPDVVRLETRNANSEGKGEINMRMLIKATMRLRPDRIIVGEVRDESAIDMLSALNTGHEGSMSTVHANSAEDAVTRLETLAMWEGHTSRETVDKMISSGINIIVHMKRSENMKRYVEEICEVETKNGAVITKPIFREGKFYG